MKNELIYLACPYMHEKIQVRKKRFEQVTEVLAKMLESGDNVFSPISMCHPVVKYLSTPDAISHSRWLELDFTYLALCSTLRVLMLSGWTESVGVLSEIEYAIQNGIKIEWINPKDYLE